MMTGEINSFRSSFFGGFNRDDVVAYIAKLAQERNELEAAKDKAENEARALTQEIEALRSETEVTRQALSEDYERFANTFESAGQVFAEYEEVFKELCKEIGMAAERANAEIKNVDEITARMPSMLASAGERFGELRSAFDEDRIK